MRQSASGSTPNEMMLFYPDEVDEETIAAERKRIEEILNDELNDFHRPQTIIMQNLLRELELWNDPGDDSQCEIFGLYGLAGSHTRISAILTHRIVRQVLSESIVGIAHTQRTSLAAAEEMENRMRTLHVESDSDRVELEAASPNAQNLPAIVQQLFETATAIANANVQNIFASSSASVPEDPMRLFEQFGVPEPLAPPEV